MFLSPSVTPLLRPFFSHLSLTSRSPFLCSRSLLKPSSKFSSLPILSSPSFHTLRPLTFQNPSLPKIVGLRLLATESVNQNQNAGSTDHTRAKNEGKTSDQEQEEKRNFEEENWTNFQKVEAETLRQQKIIATWILAMAGLVSAIVVVGGLTRLTESGLSIVDWKPVTGSFPPLNDAEWEQEFQKYRNSPEFELLRLGKMTMEEFKTIFYWEWAHRNLGRLIGVGYLLPFLFFLKKGWLTKTTKKISSVLISLVAFQGFIGWWMVKSGLTKPSPVVVVPSSQSSSSVHTPHEIPRVSQYRLATHLCIAFIIYTISLYHGLSLLSPFSSQSTPIKSAEVRSLLSSPSSSVQSVFRNTVDILNRKSALNSLALSKLKKWSHLSVVMVFVTAMSGAFVAGLDAGLIYNEFPWMGHRRIVPEEYFAMTPKIKNIFENSASVQFNHRLLATLTVTNLFAMGLYGKLKVPLTKSASRLLSSIMLMGGVQFSLGIATLLAFVPIHLAGAHQLGSLVLLSLSLGFLHNLKKKPFLIVRSIKNASK